MLDGRTKKKGKYVGHNLEDTQESYLYMPQECSQGGLMGKETFRAFRPCLLTE